MAVQTREMQTATQVPVSTCLRHLAVAAPDLICIASLDVHGYTYYDTYNWAMCVGLLETLVESTKMISRRERRARSILVLDNSESCRPLNTAINWTSQKYPELA